MGAPIVHWEINARDAVRLSEFYRNLFGWKTNSDNSLNYCLVDTGSKSGAQGGIGQIDVGSPAQPPKVTFYAEVDDPQAYLNKVESLGGRVVMPVTEIPNMVTMAMFSDPEGNIIGIVKATAPPAKPKRAKAAKKRKTRGSARAKKGTRRRRRR